jgi:biopolymer transport protein ExbD
MDRFGHSCRAIVRPSTMIIPHLRTMRLEVDPNEGNVGFQIAPMIDIVFVIMLFFMVMAGAVKVENELNTQLPGTAETSADFVDEQIITISRSGAIALNDETFDSSTSKELPRLKATLMRLKQTADAAKSLTVVTIVSDQEASYSRRIDVLDALAVGGLTTCLHRKR